MARYTLNKIKAVQIAASLAGDGLTKNPDETLNGSIKLDIADLSAAVIASGDMLAFSDEGDAGDPTRKESIDDVASLLAGDGLAATSAVMRLDFNELTAAAVDVAADFIAIIDTNDSNVTRKESVSDLMSATAGDGLTSTSGVLAVGVGALLDVTADAIAVDLTEAGEAAIANGDYLLFLDGGATGSHAKEAVADVATLFAGTGMTATNSVMNVIGGDGITANDDDMKVTPAQTTITSVRNAGLILGSASGNDQINFSSAGTVEIETNDTARITVVDDSTTVSNNLIVSGNFTVNGTTATVNSTVVTVDDPIFTLGGDTAGLADSKDRGIEFKYNDGSAKVGFFGYDDSTGNFATYVGATNNAEVFSGTLGDIDATNYRVADAVMMNSNGAAKVAAAVAGTVGNTALTHSNGALSLDIANTTAGAIQTGDGILFDRAGSNRKESIDDIAVLMAGDGLVAASAVMKLDLNQLTAAAVDITADSLAIIDANDSNLTRKESLADLLGAFNGAGLKQDGVDKKIGVGEVRTIYGSASGNADSRSLSNAAHVGSGNTYTDSNDIAEVGKIGGGSDVAARTYRLNGVLDFLSDGKKPRCYLNGLRLNVVTSARPAGYGGNSNFDFVGEGTHLHEDWTEGLVDGIIYRNTDDSNKPHLLVRQILVTNGDSLLIELSSV